MDVSFQIDSPLLDQAQHLAALTGRTLNDVVSDALRAEIERRRSVGEQPAFPFVTDGHGGLLPGVNLDNSASLRDRMDGLDAAS